MRLSKTPSSHAGGQSCTTQLFPRRRPTFSAKRGPGGPLARTGVWITPPRTPTLADLIPWFRDVHRGPATWEGRKQFTTAPEANPCRI